MALNIWGEYGCDLPDNQGLCIACCVVKKYSVPDVLKDGRLVVLEEHKPCIFLNRQFNGCVEHENLGPKCSDYHCESGNVFIELSQIRENLPYFPKLVQDLYRKLVEKRLDEITRI